MRPSVSPIVLVAGRPPSVLYTLQKHEHECKKPGRTLSQRRNAGVSIPGDCIHPFFLLWILSDPPIASSALFQALYI